MKHSTTETPEILTSYLLTSEILNPFVYNGNSCERPMFSLRRVRASNPHGIVPFGTT